MRVFFLTKHTMTIKRNSIYIFYFLFSFLLINCSDDDTPREVSPVVFDINSVPYQKLSEYNLFKSPMSSLEPVYGVLPFQPASQLFTDYALKKRFIWMPEGTSANYVADDKAFDFPTGTILVKNFYYENVLPENSKKILETRLMIKKSDGWIFANYIWNDEQTEAVYNMDGSYKEIEWVQNGVNKSTNYRIPNGHECFMCHYVNNENAPIGPKPQNINFPINFADGSKNQIQKLQEFGYLNSGTPTNVASIIDYNDTSKSLDMRARSYLEINCAHCHRDGGYSEFYPVRLNFTTEADYTALGFCVEPNININGMIPGAQADHIFYPGDHTKSVVYYRMNTLHENIKMPMIGRTMVHDEAVTLINNWVDSFEEGCE